MRVTLNQPFARTGKVDEFDVLQLKKALNSLGYYQPLETVGITDFTDTAIFIALKDFQRDAGLAATGEAKPGDDTIAALNREVGKTPSGYYLWRCVEDGKARAAHAKFNRTVRMWSDAPDPGEDFNCRCWAERIQPSGEDKYTDAIKPTIGPFDLLSVGSVLKSTAGRALVGSVSRLRLTQKMREAEARDVTWIRNAPRSQLQKKFKHARVFGIKGNANNHTLDHFRKALEQHVKSPDTIVKIGTHRGRPVTHYFNESTGINLLKNSNGQFVSAWKLRPHQVEHLEKSGNLGGGK